MGGSGAKVFWGGPTLPSLFTRLTGLTTTTVFDGQLGVDFRHGRLRGVAEPGRHWVGHGRVISVFSVQTQVLLVEGQEILARDAFPVRVSAAVLFRIVDPVELWRSQGAKWLDALRLAVQLATRSQITTRMLDDIVATPRTALDEELMAAVQPVGQRMALAIESANLRDLTLSAEVRRMLTAAELARREGLVALERARGEQAALRALGNAARMLRNNPELQNLRLLQTLSEKGRGGTVVFGGPGLLPLAPGEIVPEADAS